ncbi:MAG: 8-amino-7-oxononanoate synthase [Gammaproteobacteria bacterium]|nr:MAG: 8-amino-7-oxononanoate synthase [Gammaproteobacteria bacterium]
MLSRIAQTLSQLREQSLYRRRQIVYGPQGPELEVGGRRLLAFSSNDYLGLANHPRVIQAFHDGAVRYGVGSGASQLITGHTAAHHALEEELAAFFDRPRVLVFSTGYMANLGVMSALAKRGDRIVQDRLNHASLLDAARLSGARLKRFAHRDMDALTRCIEDEHIGSTLLATDAVFSMDGDRAPLKPMADLANRHGFSMMVDDAHGIGVLGQTGRGSLEAEALAIEDVPILVGTLGKSFGTFGAFVAGCDDLIEHLIQSARSFIYTTAPPSAIAEASRESLKLIKDETWRRDHLNTLITAFRTGAGQLDLPLLVSDTAIQPLLLGTPNRALMMQDALLKQGLLVNAIRPPSVPEGQSRLRITLSAAHSEQQVEQLLAALERAFRGLACDAAH